MTYYEYAVVPAPRRVKRVKGIGGGADLFAHALAEAINAMAGQGWEYLRSETMSAEETRGVFRRKVAATHTVLVFGRSREVTDVRRLIEQDRASLNRAGPREPAEAAPPRERAVLERMQGTLPRAEPRAGGSEDTLATPLRSSPRLGPAEKP